MRVKLVTSVADDIRMLKQFAAYYSARGVDEILVVVTDQSGDGKIISDVETELQDYNFRIVDSYVGKHSWPEQCRMIQQALVTFQDDADWFVIADLDELHEYPRALLQFLKEADRLGYNAITGSFLDRFSADGSLIDFDPNKHLFEQFPLSGEFSNSVLATPYSRTVAVKSGVRIARHFDISSDHLIQEGIANGRVRVHAETVIVHHFKWHSRVYKKYQERLKLYEKQLRNGDPRFRLVDETQRLLKYLKANNGRIDINSDELKFTNMFLQKKSV